MSENENTEKSKLGELVISEEVIASIALNAARDADGVAGFVPRRINPVSALKGINTDKYIGVSLGDNDVKITMSITVKSGANIQSVAAEVQRAVKAAVQNMTGRVVTKVNVTIAGLENN